MNKQEKRKLNETPMGSIIPQNPDNKEYPKDLNSTHGGFEVGEMNRVLNEAIDKAILYSIQPEPTIKVSAVEEILKGIEKDLDIFKGSWLLTNDQANAVKSFIGRFNKLIGK